MAGEFVGGPREPFNVDTKFKKGGKKEKDPGTGGTKKGEWVRGYNRTRKLQLPVNYQSNYSPRVKKFGGEAGTGETISRNRAWFEKNGVGTGGRLVEK